jgi:hypothetical protein
MSFAGLVGAKACVEIDDRQQRVEAEGAAKQVKGRYEYHLVQ